MVTAQSPYQGDIVLLAEDEDNVRNILCRVLRDNGFIVLEAPGGLEALTLAQKCPELIRLLITDMSMPRMNGKELAAHVAVSHPEAKVLYLSGYQDGVLPGDQSPDKSLPFLQKPFKGDDLMRKVEEILHPEEQIG